MDLQYIYSSTRKYCTLKVRLNETVHLPVAYTPPNVLLPDHPIKELFVSYLFQDTVQVYVTLLISSNRVDYLSVYSNQKVIQK